MSTKDKLFTSRKTIFYPVLVSPSQKYKYLIPVDINMYLNIRTFEIEIRVIELELLSSLELKCSI